MKRKTALFAALTIACLCLPGGLACAAWGDVSYDPHPSEADLDRAAQYDAFGILTTVSMWAGNAGVGRQNFELEYTTDDIINGWVSFGVANARFGFGASLDTLLWQSRIGGIDPYAKAPSLVHPQGTYGNAPGVLDQPRNYVADLQFLTLGPAAAAPSYFVIEFDRPVSMLTFTMLDYGGTTGGTADISLWRGADLGHLSAVPTTGRKTWAFAPGEPEGNFAYWVAGSAPDPAPPYARAPYNYLIIHFDTPDATIGFDNFTVGVTAVPEPGSGALMAGGLLVLGSLGLRSRRRRSKR